MRTTLPAIGLCLALFVSTACGSDDDADTASSTDAPTGAIDASDEGAVGGEVGFEEATPADALRAEGDTDDGGDAAPVVEASASADPANPADRDDIAPEQQQGLRAGSVDDNVDWEDYLRYRTRYIDAGGLHDEIPVDGRRIITVVDPDGAPLHDSVVELTAAGRASVVLRTGADGRAIFLPAPSGQQSGTAEWSATVTDGQASVTVDLTAEAAQTIELAGSNDGTTRLDVLFLLDATGSMADEIERLKANMVGVSERIAALPSAPDVRFALTHYRDVGDDYVARTVDFTSDVGRFVESLRDVRADGGGDMPEAFNEAFAEAIESPRWRTDEEVVRLVFVVADAPPHVGRGTSYADTVTAAAAMGVRVFPIASSGTDNTAEFVFRQVAQASLGRFVFLSYGADGAAVGEASNIEPGSYDVLALDDLVVRLVEDQLAPLS